MATKREMGLVIGACALISIGIAIGATNPESGQGTVIRVVAQRFSYNPSEIVLKKGRAATLEFEALDFTHGFNVPDLGIRADLIEGQVTQVHLTPEKSGVYEFHCDNFCGADHEQMDGKIIVQD
jgi:cytochrome c oxidase subunit 2